MAINLQKGIIFILSAPSGGGKTSITKALLDSVSNIILSISNTTRAPRQNEEHCKEYFFNTKEEFLILLNQGLFLEATEIYGNYYGTLEDAVLQSLNSNIDILFDINAQGAKIIASKINSRVVTIFLLPPSLELLEQRLQNRGNDDLEIIALRTQHAKEEIKTAEDYEYVVVNDDFNKVLEEIKAIIQAERIKNSKRKKLNLFYENN